MGCTAPSMKLAAVLCLGVLVACAEDNPARHLPDGAMVDAEPDVELTITHAGNGAGTVTSSPDGLACGEVEHRDLDWARAEEDRRSSSSPSRRIASCTT